MTTHRTYNHYRQNPKVNSAVRPLVPLLITDTLSVEISRGKLFRSATSLLKMGHKIQPQNNFCASATSLMSVEKQTSSKTPNLNNPRRSGDCYIYRDTERVSSSTHNPLLCRGTRHNTKPRLPSTITYCSNYQL